MKKKRTIYNEEIKARVVAALLSGQSVAKISEEFNVPQTTVRSWFPRAETGTQLSCFIREQKKERIGELLIEYLNEALLALMAQAKFFGNEAWLKDQDAGQLAILHGVLADKTSRIIEFLAPKEVCDNDA